MTATQSRSSDGAPSTSFLAGDVDQPAFGCIRVSPGIALKWAREAGIKLDGPGSQAARINSARFAAGLPGFVIVPDEVKPPTNKQAKPAAPPPPAPQPVPAAAAPASLRKPGPRTIETEAEFLDLVTDFDGTISSLLCTRDLAGWALDTNTANRPMNKTAVERFRVILREGQWKLTGEPIIISRQGVLSDGQHRLQAVRDTGIPALMDFRFGVDRDAFAATGTGSRRTTGNVLSIAGRQHASTQAAIARLLHHYDARSMGRSNQQVEATEVLRIAEAEASIPAVAAWMSKARFAPVKTSAFGLILAVAARTAPIERVLQFADLVQSGLADATCPARLLHVRLRDAAMARERLHQTNAAALAARAWNGWHEGRPMQRLILQAPDRTNDGFPVVTP